MALATARSPKAAYDPGEVVRSRLTALMIGSDLGGLLAMPEWHGDAACKERPEITWFPGHGRPAGPAKAVCGTCLVAGECRAWALSQGVTLEGVWGGLSTRERRRLLREQRRGAAGGQLFGGGGGTSAPPSSSTSESCGLGGGGSGTSSSESLPSS